MSVLGLQDERVFGFVAGGVHQSCPLSLTRAGKDVDKVASVDYGLLRLRRGAELQ